MKRKILSILALLLVAVTGSTHLYAAAINWSIANVWQPSNPDVKADGYVAYMFVTENTTNVPISTTTLSAVTTLLNQGKISDAIALSTLNRTISNGTVNPISNTLYGFESGTLTAFAIIFDANDATSAEHYFLVSGGVTKSATFTSPTGMKSLVFGKQDSSKNAENWLSIPVNITLKDNDDNSATMSSNYGKVANITLTRTLQAGGWNTFSVPFSTAIPSGWTVKQLASSSLSGDLLTLNFEDATSIAAGTPYLVKVNANVVNPTFDGVTISEYDFHPVNTNDVTFLPILSPTQINPDYNILFIQDGHTLTWAKNGGTINGFRAIFALMDVSAAHSFEMNFGDETTGIKTIGNASVTTGSSAVYDLQGRRVENPTHGLYIVNGKKVVVK